MTSVLGRLLRLSRAAERGVRAGWARALRSVRVACAGPWPSRRSFTETFRIFVDFLSSLTFIDCRLFRNGCLFVTVGLAAACESPGAEGGGCAGRQVRPKSASIRLSAPPCSPAGLCCTSPEATLPDA